MQEYITEIYNSIRQCRTIISGARSPPLDIKENSFPPISCRSLTGLSGPAGDPAPSVHDSRPECRFSRGSWKPVHGKTAVTGFGSWSRSHHRLHRARPQPVDRVPGNHKPAAALLVMPPLPSDYPDQGLLNASHAQIFHLQVFLNTMGRPFPAQSGLFDPAERGHLR